MQRSRRATPYPLTWEIPAAVAGLLLLLVLGAQIGRSVANLIAGAGWRFVDRTDLVTTVPALLRGERLPRSLRA